MKKRALPLLLAVVLLLAAAPVTPARAASAAPYISDNIYDNSYCSIYQRWASPVKSYLYENPDGGLTRVEYVPAVTERQYIDGSWTTVTVSDQSLVVEDYSRDFELLSSRTLPMELPLWGGFYAGENYNFLIVGQNNEEEDNSKEVIRIVRYSKDWVRLGQASLYGANTVHPFDGGSLRCAEYGGMLYIRTCHEMYASSDGRNHQANVTIALRESDMRITDSYYIVMNSSVGYVSHSFNQFVLVDSDRRIVTLDHGDAYPRSAVLMIYNARAGGDKFSGRVTSIDLRTFPGAIGDNTTGASLGGLAETSTGYVAAYNYDGLGSTDSSANRTVYLAYVNKTSGAATNRAASAPGTGTPALAPLGPQGGWLMWNVSGADGALSDTLQYVHYDANGQLGPVLQAKAPLSDCQPIQYQGNTVWYVTDKASLTFYVLDPSGNLTSRELLRFRDVQQGDYFYEPVKWALENEVSNGDGAPDIFNPEGLCTRGHILTFIYRALGGYRMTWNPPLYPDVSESDYFFYPANWAYRVNILTVPFRSRLYPEDPCPRSEVVLYLWRAAGKPASSIANPFTDVSPSDEYYQAVLWANEARIALGDGSYTTFNPHGTCTRAQALTFLWRYINWRDGKSSL